MDEAVALLEIGSVAVGLAAVDALTKRARVRVAAAGVVEPGRYLVLFTGPVGEVVEAWDAAVGRSGDALADRCLLHDAHPDLGWALRGERRVPDDPDCVGVVEGASVASTLLACDRSLKDAAARLAGLRLAPGLGGRAYYVLTGAQHDVEAGLAAGAAALGDRCHRTEVIARPTSELVGALLAPGAFAVGA